MTFIKNDELIFCKEEPKLTVNLFDEAFRHLIHPSGRYSSVYKKTTKYLKYVRDNMHYDGITLFTDSYLDTAVSEHVKSTYKIGWLMESREFIPHIYNRFSFYKKHYDFILTHDPHLLNSYPDCTKPYIMGGCWIDQGNYGLHKKTKHLSMIYSEKRFMQGHRLRHTVAPLVAEQAELYGRGTARPIKYKEEALIDYNFSIVIENTMQENYITEKLIDCLIVGTIPVYWGCPNVSKFFDPNGIITFNNVEELLTVLPTLTTAMYDSKYESIKKNIELAKKYTVTEDSLYENIFSKIL